VLVDGVPTVHAPGAPGGQPMAGRTPAALQTTPKDDSVQKILAH